MEKRGQIGKTIKYLMYGEKLVKIGLLDPEIILFKGLIEEINASKTYRPTVVRVSMHAVWANE